MATVRITRTERKAQTRGDLIAAARRVFIRRGFHAASLEEIAEDAGYTKGAVYSNFTGKDELFLALLEEHYAERTHAYETLVLGQASAEAAYRAVARFMLKTYAREPAWWRLSSEFASHAAGDPSLLERFRASRERYIDSVAGVVDALAARHGLTFSLPTRDVTRGSGALLRGMVFEWVVDPTAERASAFEEMHAAYMRGLVVPPNERNRS